MRALERRLQCQAGTALLSWLFAIEHSIWLNELRSAQRRRTGSLDGQAADPECTMAATHGNPEVGLHYRQVVGAVEALPEAQRVVMLLVAVEGLSYRDAATVLEVPIGTVMSRLARARASVGQRFADAPSERWSESPESYESPAAQQPQPLAAAPHIGAHP